MASFNFDKIPGGATTVCVIGGFALMFGLVKIHDFRTEQKTRAMLAETITEGAVAPLSVEETTKWFVANGNFSSCHETDGPAEDIEAIQGHGQQPQINELTGPSGGKVVEVGAPLAGGLQTSYTTYYRLESDCDAKIRERSSLADRYR